MYLLPLAAFALFWWFIAKSGPKLRPTGVAANATAAKLISIVLVAMALLMLVRGSVWPSLCLFGVSLWLLSRTKNTAAPASAPSLSQVRSAFVALQHDGQTDRITGVVLAGPFNGRTLDSLDRAACLKLYEACLASDRAGAGFLEPYLDRRFPGWRSAANPDSDTRFRRARFTSRMTEQEANQILGLAAGATRDDIVRAHRAAMKKWHPDQGGSVDLAARANEAKEVLLRRHM